MPSTVALLRTRPETVLADCHRLMNLAGYQAALDRQRETALKINVSWHQFFPACSTTPWQLEGVIRALRNDGFDLKKVYGCHNRTVVVSAKKGERLNKHLPVLQRYGLRNIHLYEGEEWLNIREAVGDLADRFLVLNRVYPNGFDIPRRFLGSNIIHLPTVKTHVFTTITGAMKNAFGGLLNEKRHWTHEVIHETLVDLLMSQRRIHSGLFCVTDGTFAGDGPGPRCMVPHVKNVLLASADPVAVDAVAAKLMGFDPLADVKFLRLAHERGLGVADMREIRLVGEPELLERPWHFRGPYRHMTFAARMQHAIYWGRLKRPIEWSLRTWLAPWAYLASILYHDFYWYPFVGRPRVRRALDSSWGRLFTDFENVTVHDAGYDLSRALGRGPASAPRAA